MHTIEVELAGGRHEVRVESGALARLGSIVRDVAPHARVCLAVDARIAGVHGEAAADALRAAGYDVLVHVLQAREGEKRLAAVESMYGAMLAARLERRSPVVALGGGIVGDVAGFAAATYLRGVPLVQVPTTLLAMVDAAIGGKTGVNLPLPDGEALGKNLVGAFWQPAAVIADPRVLRTLDARDLRCGLAESIKHAMIADETLLALIEASVDRLEACDEQALEDLVARSARIKVRIVSRDEREASERALLNLGHTFAHAIEPVGELDLRHGEAVAVGLCAACHCAVQTGRMAPPEARRVEAALSRAQLPVRLPAPQPVARLMAAMGWDKKVRCGAIRLVLPRGIGAAEIVEDVPPGLIEDAWRAVGAC